MIAVRYRCDTCKGTGHIYDTGGDVYVECSNCDGTGFKSDEELREIEKEEIEKNEKENKILKSKLDRIQTILKE